MRLPSRMGFSERTDIDEHAGQPVKTKEIAEAMAGNMVWCCNTWFAPSTTPCAQVAGCTFKDCQVRLATPRELYKCRMFQITTISSSWKTAAHVYPKVKSSKWPTSGVPRRSSPPGR